MKPNTPEERPDDKRPRKFVRGLGLVFSIRMIFIGIAILALATVGSFFAGLGDWVSIGTKNSRETAFELLESKSVMNLSTRKLVIRNVVEGQRGNLLFGYDRGYLIVTAHAEYGVDLSKLHGDSVVAKNDEVLIRLPPPEILNFGIDPGSITREGQTSVMRHFSGPLWRETDMTEFLMAKAKEDTLKVLKSSDMLPSRNTVLADINQFLRAVSPDYVKIRAVYADGSN